MKFEMGFYVSGNILDGFVSDVVVAGVGDESSGNPPKDLSLRILLLIHKELDRYNEENKAKIQLQEEKIQGGENAPKQ